MYKCTRLEWGRLWTSIYFVLMLIVMSETVTVHVPKLHMWLWDQNVTYCLSCLVGNGHLILPIFCTNCKSILCGVDEKSLVKRWEGVVTKTVHLRLNYLLLYVEWFLNLHYCSFNSRFSCKYRKNVKVKKDKVVLLYTIKVYRRSRGIAPLILNFCTRCRWVVNFMPLLLCNWERTPVFMG